MTRYTKTVLISLLSTVFTFQGFAFADQIKTLSASAIKPTQPAIGTDEVNYKIAKLTTTRHDLFNDFCEDMGAKGVKEFSASSSIAQPSSFTCLLPQGSEPSKIKSAVIAPDQQIYLTDGHHTLSTFRAIAGKQDFQFSVRVTNDFSQLASMDAFWQQMQQLNLTWLVDADGQTISPEKLPQQVGIDTMQNDRYRSVVYFLRSIAYEKPDNAPPFLEFYLGSWLRTHQPITAQQLATKQGYLDYLTKAATTLVAAQGDQHSTTASDSPTLAQLGQMKTVNLKKLNKLAAPGGKLSVLFGS